MTDLQKAMTEWAKRNDNVEYLRHDPNAWETDIAEAEHDRRLAADDVAHALSQDHTFVSLRQRAEAAERDRDQFRLERDTVHEVSVKLTGELIKRGWGEALGALADDGYAQAILNRPDMQESLRQWRDGEVLCVDCRKFTHKCVCSGSEQPKKECTFRDLDAGGNCRCGCGFNSDDHYFHGGGAEETAEYMRQVEEEDLYAIHARAGEVEAEIDAAKVAEALKTPDDTVPFERRTGQVWAQFPDSGKWEFLGTTKDGVTFDYDYDHPKSTTPRQSVLNEAGELIHGDRNVAYGPPLRNFQRIAELWNVYLDDQLTRPIQPSQVGWLSMLIKVARNVESPKRDNAVDAVGYLACAHECEVNEQA